MINWTKPIELVTVSGQPRSAKLVYTGPHNPTRLVVINPGESNEFSLWATEDGRSGQEFLRNALEPKQKRTLWVNVYLTYVVYHESREAADGWSSPDRIACVKVDYEFRPGDGIATEPLETRVA